VPAVHLCKQSATNGIILMPTHKASLTTIHPTAIGYSLGTNLIMHIANMQEIAKSK
jgi:hypothetical protein